MDDNTDEVAVDYFLSSSDDKEKEDKNKKEKEDKKKKEEDKNKKENNTTNTSSSKDSIAKDWLVGVPSELFKLGTMAFKGNPEKKEKKETSENIKLKEEIERIKSLLK